MKGRKIQGSEGGREDDMEYRKGEERYGGNKRKKQSRKGQGE